MPTPGIGVVPMSPTLRFVSGPTTATRYRITGTTKDRSGTPLGNCMVEVYSTQDNTCRATTTSDANGLYTVDVVETAAGLTFFAIGYLPGSPDVAGTTVNTLVGT